jgi:hypothetical protein
MATSLLDASTFDRFVSDHDIAVIGFVEHEADLARYSAVASTVMAIHPDVAFGRVDAAHRALFQSFGLGGTATAIFRARIGLYLEPGVPAAEVLDRLLHGIGALNMQRIQAEIAQEKAARESLAVHSACPATRRGKF